MCWSAACSGARDLRGRRIRLLAWRHEDIGVMAYLDHNASSPLRDSARKAMGAALGVCGNASSVHAAGRAARARIETAREQVACLAGAPAGTVVFTSGGSEANALA